MTDEQLHNKLADLLERYLSHLNHLRRPVAAEIAAQLMPIVKQYTAAELNAWVEHFDIKYTEVILGGADYVCSRLADRAVDLFPGIATDVDES